MRSLWVDFNEVFDDEYVWTSLRLSPSLEADPQENDWVLLYDDDGASCQAIVTHVLGPIVTCKLDWGQWRDSPSIQGPAAEHASGGVVLTPNEPGLVPVA